MTRIIDPLARKRAAEDEAAKRDKWYYEHSRCPMCQSPLAVTSIGTGVPDTVNLGKCTYGTCNWSGPIAEGKPPTLNTLLAELMRYIQHKKSCEVHNVPKSNFQKLKCTCGMDEAKQHMIDAVLPIRTKT